MRRFVPLVVAAVLFLLPQVARAQVLFVASLDSSQETPPTTSHAQGTAWAVLGADLNTLTYGVTYARLDSTFTAAHFHVAPPGVTGPPVLTLHFANNTSNGIWSNVPDSVVRAFLKGNVYVNVHSARDTAGEIRGQFKMVSSPGFSVKLSSDQEVPPLATGASGTGWATIDTAGKVQYRVTIAGLSDSLTISHFHLGAPGVAGPPVHEVSFSDSTSQDSAVVFADSLLIQMLKGNVYFNVHSKSHPGGEMRGQVTLASDIRFTACMDGLWEDPPNRNTIATGAAWARLSQDLSSLAYRITFADLDSTFTASHFHVLPSGDIVHPIEFKGSSTVEASWDDFPDTLLPALLRGNIYVNIHSVKYPAGEIRGYVRVAQGMEFAISMDANQETPPTGSGATGTGWAVLDSLGNRLFYHATIAGLRSDSLTEAHFHFAPPGISGPIVHPVSFLNSTTQSTWSGFSDSVLANLVEGNVYLNVQSKAHPAGEIRGQLLYRQPLSTGIDVAAAGSIPTAFKLEQNYPNPFNPVTTIKYTIAGVEGRGSGVSKTMLVVYDVLGRQVAMLVNEVKHPGVYRVTFDGSKLSSGVYFYRLAVDNGVLASKKMLLIK